MKKSKWSEQSVSYETLKVLNDLEKIDCKVLNVCLSGMYLYHKHFIKGKTQALDLPYDFIVLAGYECPKGSFYELEYTIGDTIGQVYRALLQVVDPVTDIQIVLGALKRNNLLPEGFNARRAFPSSYDVVKIGHCSRDNETKEPIFFSGLSKKDQDEISIKEYIENDRAVTGFKEACLEYYRGDVRELWANDGDTFEKVFVCGSSNVYDEYFSEKREEDMENLEWLIEDSVEIFGDYNLPYFIFANDKIHTNIPKEEALKMIEAVYKE